MISILFFILGLIFGLGVFILLFMVFIRVDGTFIIDDSDPTTTRWTLNMNTDPKNISDKKMVHMRVIKKMEDNL